MQRKVQLPVGPYPGWELDDNVDGEERELKSIPDSLVILQSLRQSRNKWLTSMFPKFSAKARGSKPPDVVPPPHTIKAYGRFDLIIGPHIFSDTAFYEVHYLPHTTANPTPAHSQGSTLYPSPYGQPPLQMSTAQLAVTASADTNVPTQSASAVPSITVTPEMVSQVNIAALTNPTLNRLLHLASAGRASEEELKTLGLLIQSLGGGYQSQASTPPPPTVPTVPESTKDPDIVIEFHDRPSDRWVLPRGSAICEVVASESGLASDIVMSMILPFSESRTESPQETDQGPTSSTQNPSQIAKIRVSKVSLSLSTLLMTWSGGEQAIERNRERLQQLLETLPPRVYLQHQLSEGLLLEEVKATVAPPYNTRSIMPSNDGTRARRKASTKAPRTASASAVAPTPPTIAYPYANATPPTPVVTTPIATTSTAGAPSTPVTKEKLPAKRKRNMKMMVLVPPFRIACHTCGQTDVPLLMGGRFCRVCIDAGRANADIPQVPRSSSQASQASYIMKLNTPPHYSTPNPTPPSQSVFHVQDQSTK